jgi:hypothetical protein
LHQVLLKIRKFALYINVGFIERQIATTGAAASIPENLAATEVVIQAPLHFDAPRSQTGGEVGTMSELEDRDEIRQLLATYTIEGDRGRVDDMLHIFSDDAVLQTSAWRAEGRAGIRKALGGGGQPRPAATAATAGSATPAAGARGRVMRHHLTSSLITFKGADAAVGRTYWLNYSEKGADHTGLYADTYKRIDGKWRIVSREVRIDWKSPESGLGADLVAGPRPAELGPVPVITGD